MKRIVVLAMGLLSLGLFLYAQEGNAPQQNKRRYGGLGENQGAAAEKLSLSGTLGLSRGIIVLKNGEETWYVPGLRHYAGFIDGLKDGAAVTLEGWGRKIPQTGTGFLWASKLILDGTEYEVGPAEPRMARGPGLRGESGSPGRGERLGPPEFQGWGRMGPAEPGRGSRYLPEIRRHFRTGPKES
jgi:hypothetical protein